MLVSIAVLLTFLRRGHVEGVVADGVVPAGSGA
jgi:hypothetical protein